MGHATAAAWTGAGSQILRAANVFKSSSPGSVSPIAVWTPAAGKKFRLLRYIIEITAEASKATTAGDLAMTFQDGGVDTGLVHSAYMPAASVTTTPGLCYSSGWVDLGGIGLLSAAADQALTLTLSFSLATGKIRIRTAGTEE